MRAKTLDVTRAIALYGAVLSTATFVWNVYREVSKRGALRVEFLAHEYDPCGPGARAQAWHSFPDTNNCLLLARMTNEGRAPIVPLKLLMKDTSGVEVVLAEFSNRGIEPGGFSDTCCLNPKMGPAAELYVLDSTGHSWPASPRQFESLRAKALDHFEGR